MTITTKKKNLTHNCSKEFHDLFHPYPEPRYSLWQYSSTDQGRRATFNWRSYEVGKYQLNTADGHFASELMRRKSVMMDGMCQKKANIYKLNNVSSRQYPISYQQYPMSSRQCSISYQQYPIVLRQNAIAYQQYPIELRQNAMSSKLCPITYRQNARSSKFCPTDVRLFNPEVQFPKASGQQIDADYHLTGSGNYEMYYQRRLKTIEEAEVTSLRGPVHTINLIFNYKTQ